MKEEQNQQNTINTIHCLTAVINANKGVEDNKGATDAALEKIKELIATL